MRALYRFFFYWNLMFRAVWFLILFYVYLRLCAAFIRPVVVPVLIIIIINFVPPSLSLCSLRRYSERAYSMHGDYANTDSCILWAQHFLEKKSMLLHSGATVMHLKMLNAHVCMCASPAARGHRMHISPKPSIRPQLACAKHIDDLSILVVAYSARALFSFLSLAIDMF